MSKVGRLFNFIYGEEVRGRGVEQDAFIQTAFWSFIAYSWAMKFSMYQRKFCRKKGDGGRRADEIAIISWSSSRFARSNQIQFLEGSHLNHAVYSSLLSENTLRPYYGANEADVIEVKIFTQPQDQRANSFKCLINYKLTEALPPPNYTHRSGFPSYYVLKLL